MEFRFLGQPEVAFANVNVRPLPASDLLPRRSL
jgi:hypothetical protein